MCVCSSSHLTGGVRADELIVDLLGFDGQFGGRFGVPVILTGKVERNVLFRELRHQEGGEGTQATCRWGGGETIDYLGCTTRARVVGMVKRQLKHLYSRLLDKSFSNDCFHRRHSSKVGLRKR